MAPPISGPSTGPSMAGRVSTDMAETSSFLGVLRNSTSRPTGSIIAPAIPWATRATISWVRSWARPQAADEIANIATATVNTSRAPKRSATQALIGMKTVAASMNMVTTRFMCSRSSSRASAMVGRAL